MSYMEEAFAPVEAQYRAQVMGDTWGHLAPQPRKAYKGFILFAVSTYSSEVLIIDSRFRGLDDSPWLYEDMYEFVQRKERRDGHVYRFDGMYTKFKNGNCRFSGQVRRMRLR